MKNYIKDAVNVFEKYNQIEREENGEEESFDFHLEEVIVPAAKIKELHLDADVIISRGLLTKLIKESSNGIPVVDIPVQGIDLIRGLYDCRERFGRKKVAVIGATNMIYGVENLKDIVDLPIRKYILNDIRHSASLVDLAASEGCGVVLSGLSTCEYAEEIGLDSLIVETGKESFHQALSEAKRLAIVSRKEQEKSMRFQTILDHAYEGVIAINLMKRISVFNTAARNILSISKEDLVGSFISDALSKGDLLNLLVNSRDYEEDIIHYNDIQLSVKKVAIFLKGNKVGDMLAIQDVTGIQEMESKIRKKIHLRGHIAKYRFNHIITRSELVKSTIDTAKSYSKVDSNVLIIGETGTGKEMYAQSIHNQSYRKNKPFVAINCAALPENLLESELFGYAEGAFTGAMKGGKQGIFELAHQGTLFLDEIGEISANLQSRLLRVLQEREVMRIGDDKVIPVDVRIIAATNKDLLEMVKNNKFREDLYYRLSVFDLHLPPLRECKEDIPLLASHFIEKFSAEGNIRITDSAFKRISEENWDGNIRQLQNFCERLAVLCKNKTVDAYETDKHLPKQSTEGSEITNPAINSGITTVNMSEREMILQALVKNKFQKGKVAAELEMSRSTLW